MAARVLVTSSSGPAWVEPQADGSWSVRDGRPWCHYAVWYPPSGARAATRVRDAFFLALVVAASPVIAGWLVVDALRERRRERAFVLSLPPSPPSPGRLPGPSDDDGRLHVFSGVAALDAWTGSSSRPYEVVAGEGLVALAARRGAATVSLDDGSDHGLEIPAAELARHLVEVGAPPPG